VEAGNVNDKQKRGDWGALGRAHRDWGEHLGRSLVQEAAGSARQERPGPRHKVRVDPFGSKHAAEGGGADIVETPFNVQKECGDLLPSHLKGLHLMGEGGNSIQSRQAGKRAALVRIEEASGTGHSGESRVHYPFEDLRKGLEKNYYTEG